MANARPTTVMLPQRSLRCALSPSGELVAVSNASRVVAFTSGRGASKLDVEADHAHRLVFLDEGHLLAFTKPAVQLFALGEAQARWEAKGFADVRFGALANGELVVLDKGTSVALSLADGSVLRRGEVEHATTAFWVRADGCWIGAAPLGEASAVFTLGASGRAKIADLLDLRAIFATATSPNGRLGLGWSGLRQVVVDLTTGAVDKIHDGLTSARVFLDDETILLAEKEAIGIYRAPAWARRGEIPYDAEDLAVSANGARVAMVGSHRGCVLSRADVLASIV